jgi:hypothetical protein
MFRTDGLDNPLSPNSGFLTWGHVIDACEGSNAVSSYDDSAAL